MKLQEEFVKAVNVLWKVQRAVEKHVPKAEIDYEEDDGGYPGLVFCSGPLELSFTYLSDGYCILISMQDDWTEGIELRIPDVAGSPIRAIVKTVTLLKKASK